MKVKLIVIAIISVLLLGCGKSEKENRKGIDEYQKKALYEGVVLMSGQKAILAELYSQSNKCFNSEDNQWLKKSQSEIMSNSKYFKSFDHKNDCTINVTFKDSDFGPDLKNQTLTLKMTPNQDRFIWSCSFSGNNKKDLPKGCE